MKFWSVLRTALFALASLGYLANGAQAHVNVSAGETLNLMMCGSGTAKPIALQLPGNPIEETEDTCCGDCTPTSLIEVSLPRAAVGILIFAIPTPANLPDAVSTRSPLWPGAPPHGPPDPLKA